MCFFTAGNLCAQTPIPAELEALKNFLIQESAIIAGPSKNAQPKNFFCVANIYLSGTETAENNYYFKLLLDENPTTGWRGNTEWYDQLKGMAVSSGNRITGIYWSNIANPTIPHANTDVSGCGGKLDLSACDQLTRFTCDNSKLTEVVLNGTKLASTIAVNVNNNSLTKFEITNVNTIDDKGVKTLKLSNSSTLGVECRGNKLTFANMPKMRIIIPQNYLDDAANYYLCSLQADSVNNGNNFINIPINLAPAYDVSTGPYSTSYEWYGGYNSATKVFSNKLSPQPSGSNGVYTFSSSNFSVGQTVYCKITNPLFSLKILGGMTANDMAYQGSSTELFPYSPHYGVFNAFYNYGEECYFTWFNNFDDNFKFTYAGQCDLVLCYQTTLGLYTGISSPSAFTASAYFSGDVLRVTSEVPIQAVSVFDLSGKELFAGSFNAPDITIGDLSPQKGIYLVKVTSDAGVTTQKLLK